MLMAAVFIVKFPRLFDTFEESANSCWKVESNRGK